MIYIGMAKLHYTEEAVMKMTPRKYFLIYDEYLLLNGLKKEDECAIDAMP